MQSGDKENAPQLLATEQNYVKNYFMLGDTKVKKILHICTTNTK